MIKLRPYQAEVDEAIRAAFVAGQRRVLATMPTGAGKTSLFVCIADRVRQRGGRALVCAHRRELIRQASDRFDSIPHGYIAAGHPRTHHAIQVGSIQTVARRLSALPRFDLIIVDEAHHAVSPQYRALFDAQPRAAVLGLTATPERLDGQGLCEVFDTLVEGPSVAWLTDAGYLSPVRVFAPAKPPDIKHVHMQAGDYMTRDLAIAMDQPTVTGDAVAHYGRHCPGEPAVVFCVSVKHAINTAAAFAAEGWRAVAVHGEMPAADRDSAIGGLATGDVTLLMSCSLIDEGLDIPSVGCVIDLAPTQALGRFMQRVGRGMRPAPGKTHLTLLDHAGNTFRHGLPDAPRAWTLEGKRRRAGATDPTVRQCPECFCIHGAVPRCPECGYDYAAAAAEAEAREVRRVAGELALMTLDDHRLAHLKNAPLRELTRGAATWDDMDAIREARGYHPQWTNRMMAFKSGRRAQ